jgi:hypothetical protein
MKKIKPEDVASELRLLSKNWCLSPEVINIISHGYERICELERERDEARREVCRDEAYRPSPSPPCTANQVANRRGWDCFKEEFFVGDDDHAKMEADSNNKLFRTTDMK